MLTNIFSRNRISKEKLDLLLSRPWADIQVPYEAHAVPTMLYYHELQLLHWLARHYVTGRGRIVDAGCFLGGSTAALASGLAARNDRRWKKTIASYDLFRVEPYTLTNFRDRISNPTEGATFLPDFEVNVAQWSQHIDVREGNAIKHGWSGERIEVLFLDLVKTWDLNAFALKKFFPCLIPNQSIIIQQDYLWGFGPWIHITMELLDPYVTLLDSMLCSVVYLLRKRIPKKLLNMNVRELPAEEKLRLMDRAVDRWTGQKRGLVELARVMLLSELRPNDSVRPELEAVLNHYSDDEVVQISGQLAKSHLAA